MAPLNTLTFDLLAAALAYPAPGRLAALEAGWRALEESPAKQAIARFLQAVRSLPLGDWEELHTRTLDLAPPAAPYIGFQTWGESYQRGLFLSQLSRALAEAGIDLEGELPDHLIPVLRYLGSTTDPLPELSAVLLPAIERMRAVLRQADPASPYLHLLEAAWLLCQDLKKEPV